MASEAEGKGGYLWGPLGGRACDTCKGSPALVYCRADAAYLCRACDGRVHGANRVASRHERVWVCEVCEQAPAVVTCKADAAALCGTCDADIHSANPLARRHERLPLAPFLDLPPSGAFPDTVKLPQLGEFDEEKNEAEAESWLLPDPNPGPNANAKSLPEIKPVDLFFSDVAPYLDLEYASSMDARFNQSDSVVPVQANAATGCAAAGAPPILASDGYLEIDFMQSKPSYSSYTATHSLSHSVSSSEVGVVPDNAMVDVTKPFAGANGTMPVVAMDREARVLRYREKRKSRKFEKTIRYASRKAYAETRPRIKGRFVKQAEIETEVGRIYSSAAPSGAAMAAALAMDPGYGVVPSF